MSEINSQTVRTANYRLHQIALKVNASQDHLNDVEIIDDCLKAFQARLEAEEEEEQDEEFVPFDVITAHDSEYQRSSIAVVSELGGQFQVHFDYGGGRNYTAWDSYREARDEAGRLWRLGWAGRIHDHVAEAADRRRLNQAA